MKTYRIHAALLSGGFKTALCRSDEPIEKIEQEYIAGHPDAVMTYCEEVKPEEYDTESRGNEFKASAGLRQLVNNTREDGMKKSASFLAGVRMAKQVIASRQDRENWRAMKPTDDIPNEDYVYLKNHGGCNDDEYRDGFNSTWAAD